MKLLKLTALSLFAMSAWLSGQDGGPDAQPRTVLDVPDDGVRVSVLGYHDFSSKERETAMRIKTETFRQQMQALQDLNIPVISMADFIAWKNGGKTIPQKCAVITIDDGWKSVYTDAFPILKEFGYPFTIYLYRDYVDGGGKALTTSMIKEMLKNGATVGGHSTTHPLPQEVKKARKSGPEKYDQFLQVEMGDSKRFLEEKFGSPVLTYAYPGGYYTEEMLIKGEELGYKHLFTVQPGKVKIDMPNGNLPRYVVLGNYDKIFEFATNFGDSSKASASGEPKELEFPVAPMPGAIINSRLPVISVDFTDAEDIDPSTLVMQVAGFGVVPANYASEGKIFSWQVNRRLRQAVGKVRVTWKDKSGNTTKRPLEWSFQLDRGAAYMPDQ